MSTENPAGAAPDDKPGPDSSETALETPPATTAPSWAEPAVDGSPAEGPIEVQASGSPMVEPVAVEPPSEGVVEVQAPVSPMVEPVAVEPPPEGVVEVQAPILERPPLQAAVRAARFTEAPIFLQAAALLGAIGASVGLMVWSVLNWKIIPVQAISNRLDFVDRRYMFMSMGLTAVAAPLLTWFITIKPRPASVRRFFDAAVTLAPLVIAGLLPLLFNRALWQGRELPGLLMTLLTVFLFERTLRRSIEVAMASEPLARVAPVAKWKEEFARVAPLAIVLAGATAYAIFFSVYSLRNHYRFATSAFDLGIENNLVWNAAHLNAPIFKTSPLGGPDSTHVGYHETFISYLIAPVYRLWPTPQFMLVMQSLVIAAAAVPLFLWLRRHIAPGFAMVVSLAYLFYPPLHGSNLYDFHYQPFGAFFFCVTLNLLDLKKWRWAAVMVVLTFSVREDMSLLLGFIAAFLVLTRQRVVPGLILGTVCGFVFVVQKLIIMPKLLGGYPAYVNQYQGLVAVGEPVTYGNVLKTVFTNPAFTFLSFMEQQKLVYFLQVMVPLAMIPMRKPIGWLLLVPGIFFTLLSTQYPALLMIGFQYTAYWSMFVFIAIGWVLYKTEQRSHRIAMVAALALATAITTVDYGAWVQPEGARGAWDTHHFTLTDEDHRRHQDAYALIEKIPEDVPVATSERLNPHLSSRANAYTLRSGRYWNAEYLLFEQRAIGTEERQAITTALKSNEFGVIDSRGGFWLLKRGADQARNRELAPYFR